MGVPGPQDAPLRCRIVRTRSGTLRSYDSFAVYTDGPTSSFLLAARKRKKSKNPHYIISLDALNMVRQSPAYCGKLRGNFIGTEFTALDTASNPDKSVSGIYNHLAFLVKRPPSLRESTQIYILSLHYDAFAEACGPRVFCGWTEEIIFAGRKYGDVRSELVGVMYGLNVMGSGGPRKMTAMLPRPGTNDQKGSRFLQTEQDGPALIGR